MIVVGEIPTRRFEMPEDTGFYKDTKINLLCRHSQRQHGEGSVVELFLKFEKGEKTLQLETDRVLEWWQIPNPAQDARNWNKMRSLLLADDMPEDAYLKVSLRSLLRKWRYSADNSNDGICFYIELPGSIVIAAKPERWADTMPFLSDEPLSDEDEEDE